MLLLFAAVGSFFEAIGIILMAPLIPFMQMGTIGINGFRRNYGCFRKRKIIRFDFSVDIE